MVTVDSGRAVPRPVRGWVEVREQRNKMRSFKWPFVLNSSFLSVRLLSVLHFSLLPALLSPICNFMVIYIYHCICFCFHFFPPLCCISPTTFPPVSFTVLLFIHWETVLLRFHFASLYTLSSPNWTCTSTMMMEATGSFETSVCCYRPMWWHVPEVTAMRTGSLSWFLTYVMKFDCGTKYVPVE